MVQAKNGDTVRVHYTGKLEDGTQFDTSVDGSPLQFTMGGGQVIPGFESAIIGMDLKETKTVTIPSDNAYGPHREEMVLVLDRDQLPAHIDPEVGQPLEIQQAEDQVVHVIITEVTPSNVTLDANHPLAGQDLIFEIELVEIV